MTNEQLQGVVSSIHFSADPACLPALVEDLGVRLAACLKSQVGLLSTRLETSADGRWLIHYSRWVSADAAQAALEGDSCSARLLGEAIWRYGAKAVRFDAPEEA